MREKKVDGHWRVQLLKIISKMNLSNSTDLKISQIIKNCDKNTRESKAKEILEIIQNCKTEKEVIQKLQLS